MLKYTIKETIKPNKEILDLLKNYTYKTTNGKIKLLENTNLQFILPVTYIITKPISLTIYEYKINEISNKTFYIKEYNQKYNLKEITTFLKKLQIQGC